MLFGMKQHLSLANKKVSTKISFTQMLISAFFLSIDPTTLIDLKEKAPWKLREIEKEGFCG